MHAAVTQFLLVFVRESLQGEDLAGKMRDCIFASMHDLADFTQIVFYK